LVVCANSYDNSLIFGALFLVFYFVMTTLTIIHAFAYMSIRLLT